MVFRRWENPVIMRSSPVSQNSGFSRVAVETGLTVRLIDDGPLSSFQGRSSSAASFYPSQSLLQAVDGVMSFAAVCQQAMFQAPQHFSSFETQATCGGWFFPPVCLLSRSLISLDSGMSRAVYPQEFSKEDVEH